MGGFGKLFDGFGGALEGVMRGSDVKSNEKKRLKAINSVDWRPAYASEYTPTFKKAESPVARAYLESMLTGSNPAAIRPGAPGASVAKSLAQSQQNEMYGTPAQRVARQRQLEQETPYKVKAPQRRVEPKSYGGQLLDLFGSEKGVRAAYEKYGYAKVKEMAAAHQNKKR
jgi:hypothetical protein